MWEGAYEVAQGHDQLLPQSRIRALLVAGTEHVHERRKVVGQDGEEEGLGCLWVHVGHREDKATQHAEDVHHPCACSDPMNLGVLGQ